MIPDPGRGRPAAPWAPSPRPATLAALPESRRVHLDVREDIRQGREPLGRIMAATKALGADRVLVLRAPFEPLPLYQVLGRQGFAHWTDRHAPDDWSVWFYRDPARPSPAADPGESPGPSPDATVRLDVRGLEPPLPMVRVLERLDALTPGQSLEILHDRRPLLLYPQLDERGFVHATDEPEPGLVRIVVRRPAAAP